MHLFVELFLGVGYSFDKKVYIWKCKRGEKQVRNRTQAEAAIRIDCRIPKAIAHILVEHLRLVRLATSLPLGTC